MTDITDKQLRIEVGHRLRITAKEFGFHTALELADELGANRAQVQAWFSALALPPVKYMRAFAAKHRLTLDWIYEGDGSALTYPLYIRLIGAMDAAEPPPPDVPPEPEPKPESAGPAYPARKAGAGGRPRARQKRANAA
jgi:hypothetical protein